MSSEEKFNLKNPAVKRIMQEVKEMKNNPSDDYMSLPLEDNIFEWQFAIRGPRDTEFEGGIYHGRIQLPSDYPLKPPSFLLLTPNGRFETNTKICLSISNYHPEHWQPSWSVRTALVALIAFMPSKPEGAVGSLDYSKEERIALAARSRTHPPKFGNEDRQKLIDEIHEYMLKKSSMPEKSPATENESTCQSSVCTDECHSDVISSSESHTVEEHDEPQIAQHMEERTASVEHTEYGRAIPSSNQESMVQHQMVEHDNRHLRRNFKTRQQKSADEKGLTMLAVGLSVAIVALLIKKFLKSYWWISP